MSRTPPDRLARVVEETAQLVTTAIRPDAYGAERMRAAALRVLLEFRLRELEQRRKAPE